MIKQRTTSNELDESLVVEDERDKAARRPARKSNSNAAETARRTRSERVQPGVGPVEMFGVQPEEALEPSIDENKVEKKTSAKEKPDYVAPVDALEDSKKTGGPVNPFGLPPEQVLEPSVEPIETDKKTSAKEKPGYVAPVDALEDSKKDEGPVNPFGLPPEQVLEPSVEPTVETDKKTSAREKPDYVAPVDALEDSKKAEGPVNPFGLPPEQVLEPSVEPTVETDRKTSAREKPDYVAPVDALEDSKKAEGPVNPFGLPPEQVLEPSAEPIEDDKKISAKEKPGYVAPVDALEDSKKAEQDGGPVNPFGRPPEQVLEPSVEPSNAPDKKTSAKEKPGYVAPVDALEDGRETDKKSETNLGPANPFGLPPEQVLEPSGGSQQENAGKSATLNVEKNVEKNVDSTAIVEQKQEIAPSAEFATPPIVTGDLLGLGVGGDPTLAPAGGDVADKTREDLDNETKDLSPEEREKAIEIAKKKKAAIAAETARKTAKEGERGKKQRAKGRQAAKAKGGQLRSKGQSARKKIRGRKKRKPATREQLRTRITTSCAAKRTKVTENFDTKKAQLDTKLASRAQKLTDEHAKQTGRLQKKLKRQTERFRARIAARKARHERLIEARIPALEKQAETDANRLLKEAAGHATIIKKTGNVQGEAAKKQASVSAAKVEKDAKTAGSKALSIGVAKAKESNEAIAGSPTGPEAIQKVLLMKKRMDQALSRATTKAKAIENQGRAKAKALNQAGAAKSKALKKAADQKADEAFAKGKQAAADVRATSQDAIARMRGESDAAVAAMEAEVQTLEGKVAADQAALDAKTNSSKQKAAVEITAQKATAMATLEAEKTKSLAEIDAREKAGLEKLKLASDKDLAKLEREISRDLKRLDREIAASNRRIQGAIAKADRAVALEVSKRKREIRHEGQRANAAVAAYVIDARRGIAAADKETKEKIGNAADAGEVAITAETEKQSKKLAADAAIETKNIQKEGEKAAKDLQAEGDKASKELDLSAENLKTEIDDEWVKDALATANTQLDDNGVFNVVTDGEATTAMVAINTLPKHLQGKVVDEMDKEAFENLLDEVPEKRREEFAPMLESITDPERKLKLWGEYHKSKSAGDAERSKDDWSETIAEGTEDEVDEEVEFLLEKAAKSGTELTLTEVDALASRKKLEHEIEMAHRVKVTNEEGTRADGSKIVWTEAQLKQMQATFNELPDGHVRNNTLLKEVRREDMDEDDVDRVEDGHKAKVGGDHSGGRVRIYDLGVNANYRHTGDARESGTAQATTDIGANISALEETLIHEVGHDIHDKNPEAYEKFQEAAGWEKGIDTDDLTKAGLTEAEMADMKDDVNPKTITKNGKVYNYRYGEYVSFDENRIPATGQGGKDTFSYARNNYKDHFAESYMKATLVPEQHAKDLLDDPATKVAAATTARDGKKAARDKHQTDLATLKAKTPAPTKLELDAASKKVSDAQTMLDTEQKSLDDAAKDQQGLKEQYEIMRNDIYKTDKASSEASARLAAKGVTAAKLAEFEAKAARLSTPKQIAKLEANY